MIIVNNVPFSREAWSILHIFNQSNNLTEIEEYFNSKKFHFVGSREADDIGQIFHYAIEWITQKHKFRNKR